MDAYLLAKVKVEQQNQQMQARWVEPIAVGLQKVLANQLGGRYGEAEAEQRID